MGLAVQYHVLSHRFRRGAELDGFCGNEIEETDGSCRELRGGRGDSGRRRCQTRGASRHAGGLGDGPARAGGPRRAGVAGLRERKSPAMADRSCWSQKSQRAVAGGGAGPTRRTGHGGPRARRVAAHGVAKPVRRFFLLVCCFVCFMLFNTCYFWILRTAYTALSLSLSPSLSLSWGTCKPAGKPPVPSSREAEPAEPRGRRPLWERGAGAAAGLVFLVPEPGSWEDRARGPGGSGVQAGEAPGSGWLSPSACCQRRDRAAGSGLGEGSGKRGPRGALAGGRADSASTRPPRRLLTTCSPGWCPA